MKKVAIGQAGGPTSVINFTLAGLVKEISDQYSIYFVFNGYQGLVNQHWVEGDKKFISKLLQHARLPGAFLGSGRHELTNQDFTNVVKNLKQENIETLIFIGGNGTMEALYKISQEAKRQNYELQIIGLPKTVDNDIHCTDHSPGFGSAAKYVAHAIRDLSLDLASMKNFEQVRVIETMGRNAGWLAAASGYLKKDGSEGPHFIALPERKLDMDRLLRSVDNAVKTYGYAIVVVSEGVLWNEGQTVKIDTFNNRTVLGGISQVIGNHIRKQLDLNVRPEILGMLQRCSSSLVSEADREEAYLVGKTGGQLLKDGKSGVMVSIQRLKAVDYEIQMKPIPLESVVRAGERLMPEIFIEEPHQYYEWLKPIIH